MASNMEKLRALRKAKKAEKPKAPAEPLLDGPASKPAEKPAVAPTAVVDEEAPTSVFTLPKKEKAKPQQAEKAPAKAEPAVAEEKAEPEETSADDLVIVESEPAPAAGAPDMDAIRTMLGEMLAAPLERLAALEAGLKGLKAAIFGNDMEQTMAEIREGHETEDGGKPSLVDVFSAELGELVTREDVGEMLAESAPAANADLSGVESSIENLENHVGYLKETMGILVGDGSVLQDLAETDEDGHQVCALQTIMDNVVTVSEFGEDGELITPAMLDTEHVTATKIIKCLIDYVEDGLEKVVLERGLVSSRRILGVLGEDADKAREMLAFASGYDVEELEREDNAGLKAEIERQLPEVMDAARRIAASDAAWETLGQRKQDELKADENGGDE